jgi:hypothetical protein
MVCITCGAGVGVRYAGLAAVSFHLEASHTPEALISIVIVTVRAVSVRAGFTCLCRRFKIGPEVADIVVTNVVSRVVGEASEAGVAL